MQRTNFFLALICLSVITIACGGGKEGMSDTAAAIQSEPAQQAVEAEEPFDLMSFSELDTNSGVFFGEYDEKVREDITVKVGLEVTLLEGRITDITLLDTTWVHPAAAMQIPQRIIEQQKLPVDAVSGASVASWSIMTATAIALEMDLTVLEDLDADSDTTDI
jgi:uncharacterized protein with FMN-binding domain